MTQQNPTWENELNFYEDVKLFMETFGQEVPTSLGFPNQKIRDLRKHLNEEEFKEILHGEATNDIAEVADGIADLIYVLVGHAIAYGINLPGVWNAVQTANMAKLWKNAEVLDHFPNSTVINEITHTESQRNSALNPNNPTPVYNPNNSIWRHMGTLPFTVYNDTTDATWVVHALPYNHPCHIRQQSATYTHLYVVKDQHGKVQKPPSWKAPNPIIGFTKFNSATPEDQRGFYQKPSPEDDYRGADGCNEGPPRQEGSSDFDPPHIQKAVGNQE